MRSPPWIRQWPHPRPASAPAVVLRNQDRKRSRGRVPHAFKLPRLGVSGRNDAGPKAFSREPSGRTPMRRLLLAFTATLLLTLTAAGAPEIHWQIYEDPAYGYEVEL